MYTNVRTFIIEYREYDLIILVKNIAENVLKLMNYLSFIFLLGSKIYKTYTTHYNLHNANRVCSAFKRDRAKKWKKLLQCRYIYYYCMYYISVRSAPRFIKTLICIKKIVLRSRILACVNIYAFFSFFFFFYNKY